MKRLVSVVKMILLPVVLGLCIATLAERGTSAEPVKTNIDSLLMGLKNGDVARVKVATWETVYYPTVKGRTRNIVSFAQLASYKKVVFDTLDLVHEIGIIDLETKAVFYLDAAASGFGKYIVYMRLSKSKDFGFYTFQSDRNPYEVTDATANEFKKGIRVAFYDVRTASWKEVSQPVDTDLLDVSGTVVQGGPSDHKSLLHRLQDAKIIGKSEFASILYLSDHHVVCRRNSELLVIQISGEGFQTLAISPQGFAMKDPRLISPFSVSLLLGPEISLPLVPEPQQNVPQERRPSESTPTNLPPDMGPLQKPAPELMPAAASSSEHSSPTRDGNDEPRSLALVGTILGASAVIIVLVIGATYYRKKRDDLYRSRHGSDTKGE